MNFAALHHQPAPLIIANVWDASSALAAHQAGYLALGTSSAAIAALLGYEDGEAISFDELLFMVTRIQAVTTLPLSVDLESGYSETTNGIIENIQRLAQLGVVGVNLEDSRVIEGVRQPENASAFATKLGQIRQACPEMFLNIRTDGFLLNDDNALNETRRRGQLYAAQGADGFFVPGVTREEDIRALVRDVPLPLNVMCMPTLADFATLAVSGVRRISMGNFVHSSIQTRLKDLLLTIKNEQSFAGVFSHENH